MLLAELTQDVEAFIAVCMPETPRPPYGIGLPVEDREEIWQNFGRLNEKSADATSLRKLARDHFQWQNQFPVPPAPLTNPLPRDKDSPEAIHEPVPVGGLQQIACRVPGCMSVFKTPVAVAAGASFICKGHTLLDEGTGPVARWRIYQLLGRKLDGTLYEDYEEATFSKARWSPKRTTDNAGKDARGEKIEGSEGDDPHGKQLQHQECESLPSHIDQYNPARWVVRERIPAVHPDGVLRATLVHSFNKTPLTAIDDYALRYPVARYMESIQRYEHIQRLRLNDFSCVLFLDHSTWKEDRRKRIENRRPFVYRRGRSGLVLEHGDWLMHVAPRNKFGGAEIQPYTYKDWWSSRLRSFMGSTGEPKDRKVGPGGASGDHEYRKYILSTTLNLTQPLEISGFAAPGVEPVMKYHPTVIDIIRETREHVDPIPYPSVVAPFRERMIVLDYGSADRLQKQFKAMQEQGDDYVSGSIGKIGNDEFAEDAIQFLGVRQGRTPREILIEKKLKGEAMAKRIYRFKQEVQSDPDPRPTDCMEILRRLTPAQLDDVLEHGGVRLFHAGANGVMWMFPYHRNRLGRDYHLNYHQIELAETHPVWSDWARKTINKTIATEYYRDVLAAELHKARRGKTGRGRRDAESAAKAEVQSRFRAALVINFGSPEELSNLIQMKEIDPVDL